jgi:Putative stress-induced transcription regulator
VLDFCNTRAGWGAPTPKEYLHSYAHLARWAADNGLLVDPSVPPGRAAGRAVVGRAIALRDALYTVLVGAGGVDAWSVGDQPRGARGGGDRVARPRHRRTGPSPLAARAHRPGGAAGGGRLVRGRVPHLAGRLGRRRLPRRGLRLRLHRPARPAPVVLHGVVRQPGQGPSARAASAGYREGARVG